MTQERDPAPDPYVDKLLDDSMLPRILVRSAECVLLSQIEMPRPILDIGCGDGSFARVLFPDPVDVGIDPWRDALRRAHSGRGYVDVVQAPGDRLPFADGTFQTVLSNSTLEHIDDPRAVIQELYRVAAPGATCIVTVPSVYFEQYLLGSTIFSALRLHGAAAWYGRKFNAVSRHLRIEPAATWTGWLEEAGFQLDRSRYYFSHANTMVFDACHYLAVPSNLTRKVFGRWVLWPAKKKLLPYRAVLSRFSTPGNDTTRGAYLLLLCKKRTSGQQS